MNDCIPQQRLLNKVKFLLVLVVLFFISVIFLLQTANATVFAEPKPGAKQLKSFNDLPPGAAPAIAKAMLKDLPQAYQLRANDKGFSMSNPSNEMEIAFTPDGLQVTSGGKRWGMVLSGMGSPGSIKPVQKTILINDDGRMVYQRGDISEWYVNSLWGVEQGFTIQTAPEGKNRENLVVELSLSGDVQPGLHGDTLVLADAQGNSILRYTGLQVFDADSKSLPAHLTLTDNTLSVHVDDTHAIYPVTIDPWIQQAKLTAGDGAANDLFGHSVAISGETIVVGAYNDDDNGINSGSAYVFFSNEYTVTYNGNTNTGGSVPVDGNHYNPTDTVTVLANTGSLVTLTAGTPPVMAAEPPTTTTLPWAVQTLPFTPSGILMIPASHGGAFGLLS